MTMIWSQFPSFSPISTSQQLSLNSISVDSNAPASLDLTPSAAAADELYNKLMSENQRPNHHRLNF